MSANELEMAIQEVGWAEKEHATDWFDWVQVETINALLAAARRTVALEEEHEKAATQLSEHFGGLPDNDVAAGVRQLVGQMTALEKDNAELHRFIERVAEHDLTSKDCGAGCLEELVRDAAILATPRQEDGR